VIKTFFLAIVTGLVLLAVYLFVYLGVSKPVTVAVEKRGPFYLLFKDHLGPYHQIAPVIAEVEKWAGDHNMRCPQTFGEYLDNPQAVDEDRLRSHGGCVLAGPLPTTPPEFQYQTRPERTYAVARFAGSPAIGPYKVYPKLRQFMEDKRLKSTSPVIEMYTVNGSEVTTEYLFAIEN
jgi:AraC family transcriptional regulator